MAKFVLDHAHQRIDPPPHILRIARHENPPHPRKAQHRRPRSDPRHASTVDNNAAAKSGGTPAVNEQRTPLTVVKLTR